MRAVGAVGHLGRRVAGYGEESFTSQIRDCNRRLAIGGGRGLFGLRSRGRLAQENKLLAAFDTESLEVGLFLTGCVYSNKKLVLGEDICKGEKLHL